MSGFLKDDLTVALDEVDRTASRIVTIYDDLSAIAIDPEVAADLRGRGERRREALIEFNHARQSAGQIPEVGDPERAHIQSLWLALKAAVSGEQSQQRLEESLQQLDDELCAAVRSAHELGAEPAVQHALDRLVSDLDPAPGAR